MTTTRLRFLACLVALAPVAARAQDDAAAITKLATDVVHVIESGDFDRLADFYSPAAVYLAEGEAPIDREVGKAVVKRWRRMIGSNRARISMRLDEVDVSGDLAYDRVSYTVTISPRIVGIVPGQTGLPGQVVRIGRALEILRKEDGVWKYYRVMTGSGSSDQ